MFPFWTIPQQRPKRLLFPASNQNNFSGGIGGPGNDIITINNGGSGSSGPPGPQGPQGIQGVQGPPGTIGLGPITIVTTTPYNVALTDYMIAVNVATPASIVLPVAPTGTIFVVKDISENAFTNPITITASTIIDGSPNSIINTDYGSITFIFNGTEWNIV